MIKNQVAQIFLFLTGEWGMTMYLRSATNVALTTVLLLIFSIQVKAQTQCESFFGSKGQSNLVFAGDQLESLTAPEKMTLALAARSKFNTYFEAVGKYLKERDYITNIIQIALIAKEHVLLMGPPGNAKSMISDIILGNITDAQGNTKSYYKIQMTPETTMSETHGPLDYVKLSQTSKYERLYEEGMLMSRNVFVDEIFDSRSNALRNLLVLMNERAHAQGPRIIKGKIETIIAATNRYISEVYEAAGNEGPKAVLDRFAFSIFVPADLEFTQSAMDLVTTAKKQKIKIPQLTFQDLDIIRSLVSEVEIPDNVAKFLVHLRSRMKEETEALEQSGLQSYKDKIKNGEDPKPPYRATKYQSPRTLNKAGGILKAIVVHDWLKSGGNRSLTATIEDVRKLEVFFTLNGPRAEYVEQELGRSVNNHEKVQLMAIKQEREIFAKHFDQINSEINTVVYGYSLIQLQQELDSAKTQKEKENLAKKLIEILVEVMDKKVVEERLSDLTGEQIGFETVEFYIKQTLESLLGQDYHRVVGAQLEQIAQTKKQAEIDRIEKEKARVEEEKRKEQERIAREREEQKRQEAATRRNKEMAAKLKDNSHFSKGSNFSSDYNQNVDRIPGTEELIGYSYAQKNIQKIDANGKQTDIFKYGMQPNIDFLFDASPTYFKAIDGERVLIGANRNYYLLNIKTLKIESDFVLPNGVLESASILNDSRNKLLVLDTNMSRLVEFDILTGGKGDVFPIVDRDILANFNPAQDKIHADQKNIYITSSKGQVVHIYSKSDGKAERLVVATSPQEEVVINNGVLYLIGRQDISGALKLKLRIRNLIADAPIIEKTIEMASSHDYYKTIFNSAVIIGDYLIVGSHYGLTAISIESSSVVSGAVFGISGRVNDIRVFDDMLYVNYTNGSEYMSVVKINNSLLE